MRKRVILYLLILVFIPFFGCSKKVDYLEYALVAAGKNRSQLESVLSHYKDDPQKLKAAKFLIENMPGHYSYDSEEIQHYYRDVLNIIDSDLTPADQFDSVLYLCQKKYIGLDARTIPDVRVITADFLIYSIDNAFSKWQSCPWASHLNFDQFCEWLLPYKAVELQQLDGWRDSLSQYFGDGIKKMVRDDDQFGTTFYTLDAVRNEILRKIKPYGVYVGRWYPLLSSELLPHQTFGRCEDYVDLAVLTYRSLGIPAVIDETPYWGRYRAGHTWYTMLNDRGEELSAEWDVGSVPGNSFFPDKRISKVFRHTYEINRKRAYYKIHSVYKYPFDICKKDVTDSYFNTTDIKIPIFKGAKLVEKYAYISTFNGHDTDWSIIDFGEISHGKAYFEKIGRNVLYLILGFNGQQIVPITKPFYLEKNGDIKYIDCDSNKKRSIEVRRKYFQSNNVSRMRNRLLGGKIQCSNKKDFSNAMIVLSIDSLNLSDKIKVYETTPYRYWRYLAADGTYGSIAELAFFKDDSLMIDGEHIACSNASKTFVEYAFDSDRLTNFETDNPNGSWVGIDFGSPQVVESVRIVPRSDENDILPGDEYELKYWDSYKGWISLGVKVAKDNYLKYDSVPSGALLWIHDYTRGWDERPFIIDSNEEVTWW